MALPQYCNRHKTWRLSQTSRRSTRARGSRDLDIPDTILEDDRSDEMVMAQPTYIITLEPDATKIVRNVVKTMESARDALGYDRFQKTCHHLDRSDKFAYNSCVELALAFHSSLRPKKTISPCRRRNDWRLLQLFQEALKQFYAARVAGWKSGLDSAASLDSYFCA